MYGSTEQRSPGLTLVDAGADRDDLDAQLVAGDARVAEERHLAEVAADVGAADADAVDADQGLAGAGSGRLGDGDGAKPAGLFELDGVHASLVAGRGFCREWFAGALGVRRSRRRFLSLPCPALGSVPEERKRRRDRRFQWR